MPAWIPVPGTTTGRLVESALAQFGAHGFGPVAVSSLAAQAGVTTGSLYHHFGSKAGLYRVVRTDVERRVLDRFEGAAAARPVRSVSALAPVIAAGFDYLVGDGLTRLLAEPSPAGADDGAVDEIEQILGRLLGEDGAALGYLIAAAWRAALWRAAESPEAAAMARTGLVQLLGGTQ